MLPGSQQGKGDFAVFSKFGLHLPLHRQSERFAFEGVEIDVSTLCDWIGAATVALRPLVEAIRAHVLAGERIHADETPVKVLAKGQVRHPPGGIASN
jgi:transposase